MDRFVSKRSSSSVDLDASSLDDVRAERAAIALSVGLSWPPDRYTKQTRGRPSRQQLWERALQDHILEHHELPHGVRLQRPAWWRPGEAIDRPLTHEELAHTKTPRAAPAAPATPAAALVEDEPSCSASKRRKIHVNPIARDWFLDMLDQWKTERHWGHAAVLVRGPAPVPLECSTGSTRTLPIAGSGARHEQRRLAGEACCRPADTTRLSEHIMKVTDVLCLSAVTIHGLVLEWLHAERLDVQPGYEWVRRLLHGMRPELQKARQVLEGAPQPLPLQEANTHRLFIKLCWLMDKHAVSADRVVNIDETSCRLFPVQQVGWGRRGVKQAQLRPRHSDEPPTAKHVRVLPEVDGHDAKLSCEEHLQTSQLVAATERCHDDGDNDQIGGPLEDCQHVGVFFDVAYRAVCRRVRASSHGGAHRGAD